jgi:hypothetical protein
MRLGPNGGNSRTSVGATLATGGHGTGAGGKAIGAYNGFQQALDNGFTL